MHLNENKHLCFWLFPSKTTRNGQKQPETTWLRVEDGGGGRFGVGWIREINNIGSNEHCNNEYAVFLYMSKR